MTLPVNTSGTTTSPPVSSATAATNTSTGATALGGTQAMYYNRTIPLGLANVVQGVIATTQNDPNTPQIPLSQNNSQMWFSQPRPCTDTTTEVLTVTFQLPLSVSELGWDALRVSSVVQPWYQDSQGNWRQVTDEANNPISLTTSSSTTASWYTAHFFCHPFVAKALQFRFTRAFDPALGSQPYVVGMRNGLIRRNIYTRSDGTQGIEPQQDALGNTINSYIQDWDASQAIDNNPNTYWLSMPQPDPSAVVNLYLDVRDDSGNAQNIDALYLEPMYMGQNLNVYYSSDDTAGLLKLSPVSAVPTTDENTEWQLGTGRWDTSTAPPPSVSSAEVDDPALVYNSSGTSNFQYPFQIGVLSEQDAWIGIEWAPDFSTGYTNNVQVVGIDNEGGPYTEGTFTLTFNGATTTPIDWDATGDQVASALGALSTVGSSNVSVQGDGPWTITFVGSLAASVLPTMTSDPTGLSGGPGPINVTVTLVIQGGQGQGPAVNPVLWSATPAVLEGIDAVQTISISGDPSGGSFTLTYPGTTDTTTALPYNATASAIQSALAALAPVGAGNVIVDNPTSGSSGPWTVTFQNGLGARAIPNLVVANSVTGQPDVNDTQTVTLLGSPTAGDFTLTFAGQTTALIAWNATPADVTSELENLSTIGSGNVVVSSSNAGGGAAAGGPWTITFIGAMAASPQPDIQATNVGLSATGNNTNMEVITAHTTVGQGIQVLVNPSTTGAAPVTTTSANQYFPSVSYNVGGGEVVLTLSNGTTAQSWACPLSPLPLVNQPVRIVAGWSYSPDTVFISVTDGNASPLGSVSISATLPDAITMDGTNGFTDFQGRFTAHVVKLEKWAGAQDTFLANPQVYVNPAPVVPNRYGNLPSTTLDNAVFAAAWKVQEFGTGGRDATNFESKRWTPILADFVTEKGMLTFPQPVSAKYLDLEFSNLTAEPYPIYDSGVTTSYQVFPVSVTQTVTQAVPGLVGLAAGLIGVAGDVILSGIGSVNWMNPSTINKAVNSIFGPVVSPVNIVTGASYNTPALPSASTIGLAGQSRQEVSTPWVYRRSSLNPQVLAGNVINSATANSFQQLTTAADTIVHAVSNTFSPLTNTSPSPTTLPVQGSDWWVFPGGTLKMPASVMNGLTAVGDVVFGRPPVTERMRFTTTSVHQYTLKTATLDAAMGYFAGVREVQPMVSTIIPEQDPISFKFSRYSPDQWVFTNTSQLSSGPVTTAGVSYEIVNSEFDNNINFWTMWGTTPASPVSETFVGNPYQFTGWEVLPFGWDWDGTVGHWHLGTAVVVANGTDQLLTSLPVPVTPGTHIDLAVWTMWQNLVAPAGADAIQLRAIFFDGNGNYLSTTSTGLSESPWPADTPPDAESNTWAALAMSATSGTSTNSGDDQTPPSPTGPPVTVPAGAAQMMVGLYVDSSASAGVIHFASVVIGSGDPVEGTVFADFYTTSTIRKLQCSFSDSGLLRSDGMWAQEDPLDTNISSTALAYYVSTIPDVIPAGMWADTFADWDSTTVAWGEPQAVVNISVDPNRIYQSQRVLHFSRASGAGEAGITVRQQTFYVASGLFRMRAVFYKPYQTTNQIIIRLRRMSDGVYIAQETFTPVTGFWFDYQSQFYEIPESDDQLYTVELVLTGDEADDLYLNDLYTEVAQIRYFVQLGGQDAYQFDVTALAYADTAIVSTTNPVSEFSVEVAILSDSSYAYGCQLTPTYLQ